MLSWVAKAVDTSLVKVRIVGSLTERVGHAKASNQGNNCECKLHFVDLCQTNKSVHGKRGRVLYLYPKYDCGVSVPMTGVRSGTNYDCRLTSGAFV